LLIDHSVGSRFDLGDTLLRHDLRDPADGWAGWFGLLDWHDVQAERGVTVTFLVNDRRNLAVCF
jgi:hypothetical protein